MRAPVQPGARYLRRAARALACAALFFAAPAPARPAVPAGSPEIGVSAAEIRAHLNVLADDLFEGREAGTRGDRLTQLYLASRMAAYGLEPAGDADGYLQRFRLRATRLVPDSVRFTVTGPGGARSFANGGDIVVWGDPTEAEQAFEAPMVFAGYGIEAADHGLADYRGLDVRGKIAVVLGGPAPFLPAADAAHHGATDQQRIVAARHGAIGLVQIWTPALETRSPWSFVQGLTDRTDMAWLGPHGRPTVAGPGIRLRALVNGAAAEAIFAGARTPLARIRAMAKTGSPRGFALPARLAFARRSTHDDKASSANVAGLLRGSDAGLRDEVVVLTAHHDHIGIGAPVNGDTIYNGALDNAIGTAGLLELARVLAAAPERPKRSILFLAVGAEEKGLVGSDFFAAHPTVRREALVADINLDGIIPFYDFSDVIAFGAEQSELTVHLAAAAGQLGLAVAPDPFPEEGIFTRSDQYSFVKRGIPSVFLYVGFTDMAGRRVGRDWWDRLSATVVHQPGDDLAQPIDDAVTAKFVDLFRRLALETANAPVRPRWYDDSSFGRAFAPDRPKAPR